MLEDMQVQRPYCSEAFWTSVACSAGSDRYIEDRYIEDCPVFLHRER